MIYVTFLPTVSENIMCVLNHSNYNLLREVDR